MYFVSLLVFVAAVLAVPPGDLEFDITFPGAGQILVANEIYDAEWYVDAFLHDPSSNCLLCRKMQDGTEIPPLVDGLYIRRWSENDQHDQVYYPLARSFSLLDDKVSFEIPSAQFTPDSYQLYLTAEAALAHRSKLFTIDRTLSTFVLPFLPDFARYARLYTH
ncbi:hypothetical protein JVU11DRAFT_3147 [Chiua virens]|nr:hypothetical protein JVU11DRAFT_3147 [Chiua virens]